MYQWHLVNSQLSSGLYCQLGWWLFSEFTPPHNRISFLDHHTLPTAHHPDQLGYLWSPKRIAQKCGPLWNEALPILASGLQLFQPGRQWNPDEPNPACATAWLTRLTGPRVSCPGFVDSDVSVHSHGHYVHYHHPLGLCALLLPETNPALGTNRGCRSGSQAIWWRTVSMPVPCPMSIHRLTPQPWGSVLNRRNIEIMIYHISETTYGQF